MTNGALNMRCRHRHVGLPIGASAGDMVVRISQNSAESGQTFGTGIPKALGYAQCLLGHAHKRCRVGRPFCGDETIVQLTITTLHPCFSVAKVFLLNQATQHWSAFRIARRAREPPAVAICTPCAPSEGGQCKPCPNVMGFDLASSNHRGAI